MKRIVPVIVWDGNHGRAPDGCHYEIYSEQARGERRWWGVLHHPPSIHVAGRTGAEHANVPGPRRGNLVDGTFSGEQTARNMAERHYAGRKIAGASVDRQA